MESIKNNYSIGMRFKMRFEGEEAPEQRYALLMMVYYFTDTIPYYSAIILEVTYLMYYM